MLGALLISACSASGSDGADALVEPAEETADSSTTEAAAEPTEPPAEPTSPPAEPTEPPEAPTAVPEESTAAPEPPAEPTDADRIAAAREAFTAGPGATFEAFDGIGTEVAGDTVTLTVCAWSGAGVDDQIVVYTYNVSATADGVLEPELVNDVESPNRCLNSGLLRTATEFVDTHDALWRASLENPAGFNRGDAARVFTAGNLELSEDLIESYVADDVQWQDVQYRGDVAATAIKPVAWRRYTAETGVPIFALAACREMLPDYGLYRNGQLLDDGAGGLANPGDHSVVQYKLARVDGEWRVDGLRSLVWTDCDVADSFGEFMNVWDAEPTQWLEVPTG